MLAIAWDTEVLGTDENGDLTSSASIHLLQFDCVTSEKHEGSSIATEHTVESGAPLTDHKRPLPRKLSIEAIVTQTPLDAPPLSGTGDSNNVTASIQQEPNARANVVTFSQPFDRIRDVINALDSLRLDATSVTISTKHRTYDEVQIMTVTEPREADDGDSLRFSIEIQEIRVASSRSVDSPRPRESRGASTSDRGGQEAGDATRESSTLARARDEYDRRRAAGESRSDAALGAAQAAVGL